MKPLSGYTIAITGTLSVPRVAFTRLLEDAGAVVKSTITRDTTLLVMGNDPGYEKVDKARELGVTTVVEEWARAAMQGQCGVTKIGLGKTHIQKVYGASDDLVELTGAVRDELAGGDEDTFIRFTNGTYVAIRYNDEGIWRARVIDTGRAKVRTLYGVPDDADTGQAHKDPDAPVYSDVLIIESPDPIELGAWGRKPLAAPRPGLAKAKAVIEYLRDQGPFDDWWSASDTTQDQRNETLEGLAALLEEKT